MNAFNTAALINLVGFTTGAALYALLLWMVARRPANKLLLATALLGLVWNVGGLAAYGARDFGFTPSLPWVLLLAYAALGFLPAVLVHLAWAGARGLVWAAYALSSVAAVLHLRAGTGPSLMALRMLTVGYVALLALLFYATRREAGRRRAVWASALAVFAVSALHLSGHRGEGAESWFWELAGHHSSVLLVLAILYEDYRFAFADLFLKRALALLLLVALALGSYGGIAAPLLARGTPGPFAVSVLLGLWVLTALAYPSLRGVAHWFVAQVVLRRPDYVLLRNDLAAQIATLESASDILEQVCRVLTPALSAREVAWRLDDGAAMVSPVQCVALRDSADTVAQIFIPTTEPPSYTLSVGPLSGGRRLLSDDIAFLESVALLVARRLDVLRVTHERCEQSLRAQEISKLATEAQLRALRAQINPHFLFNALTTIGYLIQTAPERALETLLKLTNLLRGVLRTTGEFVTLDEELKIIAAYLDIEEARFEERLRVQVIVPEELRAVRVPSLLLQPLVENAIKHGIAPAKHGGAVTLSAGTELSQGQPFLVLQVRDTGVGASEAELARGRQRGVGLNNVEQRLRSYCGTTATLRVAAAPGAGATAVLRLPLLPDRKQVAAVGAQESL